MKFRFNIEQFWAPARTASFHMRCCWQVKKLVLEWVKTRNDAQQQAVENALRTLAGKFFIFYYFIIFFRWWHVKLIHNMVIIPPFPVGNSNQRFRRRNGKRIPVWINNFGIRFTSQLSKVSYWKSWTFDFILILLISYRLPESTSKKSKDELPLDSSSSRNQHPKKWHRLVWNLYKKNIYNYGMVLLT